MTNRVTVKGYYKIEAFTEFELPEGYSTHDIEMHKDYDGDHYVCFRDGTHAKFRIETADIEVTEMTEVDIFYGDRPAYLDEFFMEGDE